MERFVIYEGHTYRPASDVQPRPGDHIEMLDRAQPNHPWVIIRGHVSLLHDNLMLGSCRLNYFDHSDRDYHFVHRYMRIIDRHVVSEPTGLGAVVCADNKSTFVRDNRISTYPWVNISDGFRFDWSGICHGVENVEVLNAGWNGGTDGVLS